MDTLIIGGGMANTFLFAQGYAVGRSLHEPGFAETVDAIMSQAAESGCKIVLQVDAVVAAELKRMPRRKPWPSTRFRTMR